MLVLTRHLNEGIRIGEGVVIKILSIDSNNVKIGIEAPKDIPVLREEIYIRIKEENLNASKPSYENVKDIALKLKEKASQEQKNKLALCISDNNNINNKLLQVANEDNLSLFFFDVNIDKSLELNNLPDLILLYVNNKEKMINILKALSSLSQKSLLYILTNSSESDKDIKNIYSDYKLYNIKNIDKLKKDIKQLKLSNSTMFEGKVVIRNNPFTIELQ